MSETWKHETNKDQVLHKYRAFTSFENVVDIIVNQRLYAASYKNMNDPMEGCYDYSAEEYDEEYIQNTLEKEIEKQKFCSLSQSNDIDLMWGHYADGHRGICFGVKLKNTKKAGKAYKIVYSGQASLRPEEDSDSDRAKKVLRRKTNCWSYEEEVRLFSDDGHLVDVEIVEVIFGSRVDPRFSGLVKKLVSKYLPSLKFDESVNGFINEQ